MFDFWQYQRDMQLYALGMFAVFAVGLPIGIALLKLKDKVVKWWRCKR